MSLFRTSLAAVLGLFVVLAVQADTPKLVERVEKGDPTTDKEFLIHAIACEMAEVKFADLAKKRAGSEDVRNLADTMLRDHTKTRDALLEQAKKMKLAVVEGLDKNKQDEYNRLSKLEGKDFDREFLQCAVKAHEKSKRIYTKWSKDASDADVKKAAESAMTTTTDHLDKAKKLSKSTRD